MKKYEKSLRVYLLIFLLFIVVISASASLFITSPYFALKAKSYLSLYLSNVLQKSVKIKKLRISIFAPQIKLYGVSIKNFARIGNINIVFGPLDLLRRKIIIYDINIVRPHINIVIKNNTIYNYKKINSVIKDLADKSPLSLISVSYDSLKITGADLSLNEADKNITLRLKNFDFTVYKKPNQIPFLPNTNGIYFRYKMPYIFLKSIKLKQVFSSNAFSVHYFEGFLRYRRVSLNTDYFTSVSNGILDIGRNTEVSEIVKKISDTTKIKVNRLSSLSKRFTNISALKALKGSLNVKLFVTGDFSKKIRADAVIRLKNFVFSGGDVKSGIIEAGGYFGKVKNTVIRLKKVNLDIFGGNLKSTGVINFSDREGKFKSILKNIKVGRLIRFYYSEKIPQFKAIVNGSVKTFLNFGKKFYVNNIENITLNKPVEFLKYKNKKGKIIVYYINYRKKGLIKGETFINDKFVLLKNVRVSSSILKGTLTGKINYDKSYLNIKFNSSYKELPFFSFIDKYKGPYFEPSGNGTLEGDIFGKFKRVSFKFRNRFKSLYINKYIDRYQGDFDFDVMPHGKILFKKIFLTEKKSKLNKNRKGSILLTGEIFKNEFSNKEYINASFKMKNIHIISRKSPIPFFTVLSSQGMIRGKLKNPHIDIEINSKKSTFYNQNISDINLTCSLNGKELKVKKLYAIYNGAAFNVSGTVGFKTADNYKDKNNYNLRLISKGIKLRNLDAELFKRYHIKYPIGGTVDIALHIGGSSSLPNISGNVFISDININGYLLGNANAKIYSYMGKTVLNISALRNRLKTKAVILLKNGYRYTFNTNINFLNMDYRKTRFRVSGGIYGGGRLSNIKNSYIFTKLDYLYLKHGSFILKNTKDIKISLVNGKISLSGFELRGGNNYLQIRGDITRKKYNIIINDRTDLWILRILYNKIINSSGFLTGSAVIFGSLSAPQVYGFANINKGLVETAVSSGFTISRIFARLSFDDNVIALERARFRLFNGIFAAKGVVRLKNFKPAFYDINTNFISAIYRQSNYFYVKMNGRLGYIGRANNATIYGNVDIERALYDKAVNLSLFLLRYKKYNIIKPIIKKGVFNPKLNIRIKSNKGIAVRNNIIDTNFNADLRLTGTVREPVLAGTVSAERGEIYFRGTEFRLAYANLDFNDPYGINPSFAVSANTHINRYIIRMNASGSLLNFNVNLSSTPSLSELNIVSMLALGVPATSVYAGSAGGIAASEAASAIGGGVEQSITGAISSYFGFKNLSVSPSYSAITHSVAPRVTVTKTLTDRLSVSYSNIVSSQSSQSVTLTYKLSSHISVIGEWENNELAPNNSNIYSEVGGNIVFHFKFY